MIINLKKIMATLCLLFVFFSKFTLAEDRGIYPAGEIVVGTDAGVLWEGYPFDVTISGPINAIKTAPFKGLAAITNYSSPNGCMKSDQLTLIGGIKALQIAPGLGLVPRATAYVTYTAYDGSTQSFSGTIGYPETKAVSSTGDVLTSPSGYEWCLPPFMAVQDQFFSKTGMRTARISGNWVLVGDGTQLSKWVTSGDILNAASFSLGEGGNFTVPVQQLYGFSIRVRDIKCSVNTPTVIDFGHASRDLTPDSQLSITTRQLSVSCEQYTDYFDTTVSVQFRALSGLYGGSTNKLSLNEGGGYITGEIPDKTGVGVCGKNQGITFDNTPVQMGIIWKKGVQTIDKSIIWRLCSGGSSLPSGPVTASTEMIVTFS